MKKYSRFIFPLLLFLLTLSLLFVFKMETAAPVWRGWRVLAVEARISEQQVLAALRDYGAGTVISLSSKSAASYPNYTIESIYGTQFSPLLGDGVKGYGERLMGYFFDASGEYRLYYMPNNTPILKKAEAAASSLGAKWGMDEQSSPSVAPAIFCLLLSLYLLWYSLNRTFFICLQAPLVLLSFLIPAVSVCAAACFTALAVFCAQKVWFKPHAVRMLKKNVFFLFLCAAPLIPLLADSIFYFLLFFCAILCSFSLQRLYVCVSQEFERHRRFNPVLIRPARKKDFSGKSLFRFLLAAVFSVLAVLLFFTIFYRFLPSSGISGLSIPAPVRYTKSPGFDMHGYEENRQVQDGQKLPSLSDYVLFCWNSAVFPYTRLYDGQKDPVPGDTVVFPGYKAGKDGRIEEFRREVQVFDSSFISRILHGLDKMDPVIEKVLYGQGRFFTAAYAGGKNRAVRPSGGLPIFVIVILLTASLTAVFLYRADKWLK